MAINKISGNILQDNLVRGSNLAIQGNLIYFDVINNRVGVKISDPRDDFEVVGVANASNVRITSATAQGIFYASNDLLAITSANLTFDGKNLSVAGNVISGNIVISGDISTAGNITGGNLLANGAVIATGNVSGSNIATTGNINATNITAVESVSSNLISSNTIAAGNISGNTISVSQNISALGNIVGGNILTNGVVTATGNVSGGNIISSGTINTPAANIGNLTFSNTTISTSLANGNITLTPTGSSLVVIDTTTGITLPTGNSNQRPLSATTGTIRFNTELSRVEVWDGTEWDAIVSGVTNQVIVPDGSSLTYPLDRASTSAATLVAINGVIQLPNSAYTVLDSSITFTEPPLSTDIIDIRFL